LSLYGLKNFQCGVHGSISDARLTAKLDKLYLSLKDSFKIFPPGQIQRTPRPAFSAGDSCRCKLMKKKNKENKNRIWFPEPSLQNAPLPRPEIPPNRAYDDDDWELN